MPPKKERKKGKKGKGKKEEAPAPVVVEQQIPLSEDSMIVDEIDLLTDINDEFFNKADRIVQTVAQLGRTYEANKIRKYVNIISNLHRKYVDEVKLTSELKPEVERADYKLRVALELTGTSQEAMEHLKEALSEAWKEADTSQVREQDVQEKMQELLLKCESYETKQSEKQDDSAE